MGKRTIEKHIKYNAEEWEIVSKKAAALGQRAGTFIREMSVQGVIKNYDMSQFNHLVMSFNRTATDFENVVNNAKDKWDRIKKSRDELLQKIAEKENILREGARFVELNKIKMPTADQLDELAELSFLSKYNLRSEDDITAHGLELERLKSELSETEKNLDTAAKEKSTAAGNYKTYLRQMQSDYDFILERQRRKQEELEQAEREFLQEQKVLQQQEKRTRTNQTYYR